MIALNHRTLIPSAIACLPLYPTTHLRPSAPRRESRGPPKMSRVAVAAAASSPSTSSDDLRHLHQGPTCSSTRTLLVAVDESSASKRAVIFALDHIYRPGGERDFYLFFVFVQDKNRLSKTTSSPEKKKKKPSITNRRRPPPPRRPASPLHSRPLGSPLLCPTAQLPGSLERGFGKSREGLHQERVLESDRRPGAPRRRSGR